MLSLNSIVRVRVSDKECQECGKKHRHHYNQEIYFQFYFTEFFHPNFISAFSDRDNRDHDRNLHVSKSVHIFVNVLEFAMEFSSKNRSVLKNAYGQFRVHMLRTDSDLFEMKRCHRSAKISIYALSLYSIKNQ